jgi:hypothetical protein
MTPPRVTPKKLHQLRLEERYHLRTLSSALSAVTVARRKDFRVEVYAGGPPWEVWIVPMKEGMPFLVIVSLALIL